MNIKHIIIIGLIIMPAITFGKDVPVSKFKAKGDGQTDDTRAIQRGIDFVSQNGGTLVFTRGTYLTGTVYLKSNTSMRIENGAVWKGIEDLDKYPLLETGVNSRMDMVPRRAMIYANNVENISISGKGMIYPSGDSPVFQDGIGDSPNRPYGIQMVNSRNISLTGIHMQNSAFWMQRYFQCHNLRIDGITVFNHSNMNNDGIDIDSCTDVIISNSNIDASDDAIVFKSEGNQMCSDVVVTNCILSSHASAIKFGTASVGGFERFAISNITIRPSRAKVIHHPMGSWNGLNAIDIANVDGGVLRNISISNVVIDSIETAFFIRLGTRHNRPWEEQPYQGHGSIENVAISNIIATNIGKISSSITGVPSAKVKNIRFENIYLSVLGGGALSDFTLDINNNDSGYPINRMFNSNLPSYGFYVRHVDGITFRNVDIVAQNPDHRSAIVFDDVRNAVVDQVRMDWSEGSKPAITIQQGHGIVINQGVSGLSLKNYLEVVDDASENIILRDHNYPQLTAISPPLDFRATTGVHEQNFIKLKWEKPVEDDGGIFAYNLYKDGEHLLTTRETVFYDFEVQDNQIYIYSIATVDGQNNQSEKVNYNIVAAEDTVPVRVLSSEIKDNQTIRILLSEPGSTETFKEPSNYILSPDLAVAGVKLLNNGQMIELNTDPLKQNTEYALEILKMADRSKSGNLVYNQQLIFVDDPIAGYWSFDEGQGDQALDSSPHQNHGKVNNPVWVEGVKNTALFFDGKTTYVDCGISESLHLEGDMAVSLWFRLEDKDADSYMRFLSRRKFWDVPEGYELEYNPHRNRLNLSGGNQTTDDQGVIQYTFDSEWHHLVAMIRDGEALFYINGKFSGKNDWVAEPALSPYPLIIGATSGLNDHFHGIIDEVILYNRALSEKEVQYKYGAVRK